MTINFNNNLIKALAALSLLSTFSLQAADLMDIFRSARDHSPAWEAKKLENEGEQQRLAAAESYLYPQILFGASARDIETSGSGLAQINPVYLDEDALTTCIVDTQLKNRSCNPPLIIRDDLGGRYDTFDASISFKQPLYNYALWRKYNQTKISNDGANSLFERAKQDLMLKVSTAYFAVLEAQEQWEFAQTQYNSAEKQLEQTKKRFQLGLLPQNDVYDVRSARDLKRVEVLLARTELENSQENLMLQTQRRDVSLATLSDELIIESPQPRNVEEWVKKGLKHNRTLQGAHAKTLAAEQEVGFKKGGYHPVINLIAGYNISKNDRVAIESAPSVKTTGIGVEFIYPIYKGGLTTAEVKGSKLALSKAQQEYEEVRRDVIRKVRNAYRKVNNDVESVAAANQAIHSSKKSLEAAKAGYENGTRPLGVVIQAQNDWFKAKKQHATTRYNYILDSLQLKYDAGTLAIEDIQVINSWLDEDQLILPPTLNEKDEIDVDIFY
jgi:outer membrane protein